MQKVSVIIPSYNCAKYLSDAINSVLAQTYQNFEVVVIDDGSADNTRSVIQDYLNKYPEQIRYIYQPNQGQVIARNVGIKEAKGEYIALLDADDTWLPNRLEEGVNILNSYSNIALVHSNIARITEEGQFIDIPKRKKKFLSGHIFEYLITQDAHISCPTVLFRRDCCDKVGFFDENLRRLGSEDRDLWIRIAKRYEIKYTDKALANYRMRHSSFSRDRQKMLDGIRYVIDKYCADNNCKQGLRNRAMAKVYRDLGDDFLFEHNFAESKKSYIKALSFKPFSFWPMVNFLKASLSLNVKLI